MQGIKKKCSNHKNETGKEIQGEGKREREGNEARRERERGAAARKDTS